MERLTTRKSDFAMPKRGTDGVSVIQAVDRLAEIEDILGDDYDLDRLKVLVNQCMTMREEVAERFSITKDIPIDRLRELVEAERDGRCIIYKSGYPIVSQYYKDDGAKMDGESHDNT